MMNGNLDDYFGHENQACPPALSDIRRESLVRYKKLTYSRLLKRYLMHGQGNQLLLG
jgi:hypothetical protein